MFLFYISSPCKGASCLQQQLGTCSIKDRSTMPHGLLNLKSLSPPLLSTFRPSNILRDLAFMLHLSLGGNSGLDPFLKFKPLPFHLFRFVFSVRQCIIWFAVVTCSSLSRYSRTGQAGRTTISLSPSSSAPRTTISPAFSAQVALSNHINDTENLSGANYQDCSRGFALEAPNEFAIRFLS